uniref:Putative secreted protein n=1 Tax=Ixodes ricinus TaxID=34613 RepID=A0A6B0UE23_IXORI
MARYALFSGFAVACFVPCSSCNMGCSLEYCKVQLCQCFAFSIPSPSVPSIFLATQVQLMRCGRLVVLKVVGSSLISIHEQFALNFRSSHFIESNFFS